MPSRPLARTTCKSLNTTYRAARSLVEERRRQGDSRESLLDCYLNGALDMDNCLADSQIDNVLLDTLHQGGVETTTNASLTTILHFAQHPEFQKRARDEPDRICGLHRLPRWSDFKTISYINCIVKQGLRLRTPYARPLPLILIFLLTIEIYFRLGYRIVQNPMHGTIAISFPEVPRFFAHLRTESNLL